MNCKNSDIDGSVEYVIDKLKNIDEGKEICIDFISTEDVNRFCNLSGFTKNWGGKAFSEITEESSFGPRVVNKEEAKITLHLLKAEIDKGTFEPKYPDTTPAEDKLPFDTSILDDFLSAPDYPDKKYLGHLWEYQYALGVELEHGRTRGTNVTNNHPLLTGMIVMAHLTEDTLYYARLWVMEVEGELFNAYRQGKDTVGIYEELTRAKQYLSMRESEKLACKIPK